MPKLVPATLLITVTLGAAILAHPPSPGGIAGLGRGQAQEAPIQPTRFAGTWVGTQAWALKNPPPGASQDQPVTLTLEVVDGKVIGTMVPFLGGEEGATIVDSVIIGEELRATAIVGRPRTAQTGGRRPSAGAQGAPRVEGRGGGPPGWKDAIKVAFVFRNDAVTMHGTADVQMGDVPWLKFNYQLGKKRNRY